MDLAGFINRIERAEVMGIFHAPPMEYSAALPGLDRLKRLANAMMTVQADSAGHHGKEPGADDR